MVICIDSIVALTLGCYICLCVADVDECLTSQQTGGLVLNDCSPLGTCINEIGSFNCSCKEGYSGNGRTCEGIFIQYISKYKIQTMQDKFSLNTSIVQMLVYIGLFVFFLKNIQISMNAWKEWLDVIQMLFVKIWAVAMNVTVMRGTNPCLKIRYLL